MCFKATSHRTSASNVSSISEVIRIFKHLNIYLLRLFIQFNHSPYIGIATSCNEFQLLDFFQFDTFIWPGNHSLYSDILQIFLPLFGPQNQRNFSYILTFSLSKSLLASMCTSRVIQTNTSHEQIREICVKQSIVAFKINYCDYICSM